MECFICREIDAIEQGCPCNVKSHPRCIDLFNTTNNRSMELRLECTICKKKFGRKFIKKLKKINNNYYTTSMCSRIPIEIVNVFLGFLTITILIIYYNMMAIPDLKIT